MTRRWRLADRKQSFADENQEIGRQKAGDLRVEIRRLADRKQETRRRKSGDRQTESSHSQVEIRRLADKNCIQPIRI